MQNRGFSFKICPAIASEKSGDDFLVRTILPTFHDRAMPEFQAIAHSIGNFLIYND